MKVLQTIIIAALLILTVYKIATVGNSQLQKNKILVCMVKDSRQEPSMTLSECWNNEKDKIKTISSLSVQSLINLDLLRNYSQELVSPENQDLCFIQLPQPWNDLSSRSDPRARQITYYQVLASKQNGLEVSNVKQCAEFLPSSSFLYFVANSNTWLADERFSALTNEIAYQADHGWTRPLWRSLNAMEQGENYQESGSLDLAAIAYKRALESISEEDYNDRDYYSSQAYLGLAEVSKKNGDLRESVEYYQLAIKTSDHMRPQLTPEYIQLLFEDDPVNAPTQLISFIADNDLGRPEYIFTITAALVDLSQFESADKLLDVFRLPDSPYWLAANGVTARARGQLSDAASYFARAFEAGDNVDPSTLASWAARLAVVHILNEDFEAGIEAQKLAASLRPDSPFYWHDLAQFYQADNKFDLALEAIDKAIELAPENVTFQDRKDQIIDERGSSSS